MMIWFGVLFLPFLMILVGLAIRPKYIHRGLTTGEWMTKWPGDEFVPHASPSGSRATLINAPAHEVWRWITQIGRDRGGFYSYRWLENLVGSRMPDVREHRDEWSTRKVGEMLIMAPPERFGKIATMEIVKVEEGHYFVAKNFEGTWAFIIVPISASSCRFIARGTWAPSHNIIARIAHAAIFDPIHFIMEWKMIRQVKHLAENEWAKTYDFSPKIGWRKGPN